LPFEEGDVFEVSGNYYLSLFLSMNERLIVLGKELVLVDILTPLFRDPAIELAALI
jgi:hypothetical protein